MTRSAAEIFHEAREIPAEMREGYLVGACGRDLALRATVEALLKADAEAGGFLASPTRGAGAGGEGAPSQERPGAQIGRYKLLEQIGEGGMGTIWMAEQREPVKRRVALKIIKLGMDTKQVIARFEAERQALAMMDHPHIAKVLDAGATETGRPYFVMEYIKGIPILEYCDQEKVDTKARLELFTSVCHAIQHAHHKGIIHRDIKPSNVLVTMHDGVPVPKVIDFGIAKATNSELTTKTLFTEHRQMIGTPAYMSPEQAEMSGLDIDTRSDVYALGVLLYELLTGTTPFDTRALLESGYNEMLRAIREDEPHKPSTRISSLGDTGTSTAQKRRVEQKKLSLLLRGDIDWIVMKCLEKDRTRRYETANGLAADIKRHLVGDAVLAAPPSASYRMRKFVRRHRGQVAAAGVVLAVLVLGVVGTTLGWMRALHEKKRADAETVRAEAGAVRAEAAAIRAEAAQQDEATARQRAETITGFVVATLRSSDAENAGGGQGVTVLAAMDNALADIESGRFAEDPATEAGLQVTIGMILRNNGRLSEAERVLAQALETFRGLSPGDSANVSLAMTELGLAKRELGNLDEARQLSRKALEMSRRLYPGDHEKVSTSLTNLAYTLAPDEAEPLLREALAMSRRLDGDDSLRVAHALGNLASTLYVAGRNQEAEPLFEQALASTQRAQPGDSPSLAAALDNLGKARQALGRGAEAVDLFRKSLEMTKRIYPGAHPAVVTGINNLAYALQGDGHLAQAAQLNAEALEMERRIPPGDGPRVATALSRLADALLELGRSREAEPLTAEALGIRRRLHLGDDPEVAACLAHRGRALRAVGRTAEAGPLLTEALEMYRRLAPKDTPEAAFGLDNLGKTLAEVGRQDEAVALLTQALAMRERIHKGDDPDLSKGLNNLAAVLFNCGRVAEAESIARRALEMTRRVFHGDHPELARTLVNLATLLNRTGRVAEAEPLSAEAVAMYQRFFQGDDLGLARAMLVLGQIRGAMGRLADTVALQEEALAMTRRLLPAEHPDVLDSMTRLGTCYYAVGAFDKAIPLFEEALKRQEQALGREDLVTLTTIGNLGANYVAVGRCADAVPLLEEVRKHARQYPQLDFVSSSLLDAYVHAPDPAKAMTLAEEINVRSRALLPEGSPQLAQELASVGLALVGLKAWTTAEPVLREVLAIREQAQPDAWTTFHAQSLLGDALLGQGKYAEAEPLLLAGYRGMKEREAIIPGHASARIPQSLERLVRLYEAQGDDAQATLWREELAKARKGAQR